ncbi:jg23767 [Pararge aegeria aegeria]|uniref:Jg23767 protein n=1 Tax=Pararge aegeria aegeria TaxID=348720 RepID=A0A8S4SN75_9NEOP|nr:jg23767 [Pararge aegeria aegeria]
MMMMVIGYDKDDDDNLMHSLLLQLDTLVRVLTDRKWTVGQLARAMLRFARQTLHEPHVIPDNQTLFDELIGIEKVPDDY